MGLISKVLKKTGAMLQDREMLYKSVAQTVLLYGSESWVVMGEMLKFMEGFQHREYQRITIMMDRKTEDGEWV